jgi:phosphoribosyl-ATP pyrophosphohydrolase/phosphoribosyl-AMP cyclohydrolase
MELLEKIEQLDFLKTDGLIPTIIQHKATKEVLMLGFMNHEAIKKTVHEKVVTFFSRTKNRLWTKGETSNNFLRIENPEADIIIDCDSDTLLVFALPDGPVCHTGDKTCFGNSQQLTNSMSFLSNLQGIIQDRKVHPIESSYTSQLFTKGVNKIAQKVGEEAVETIIEAKDSNDELFINEAADLLYHYMILLVEKGYTLEDVTEVLHKRHTKPQSK